MHCTNTESSKEQPPTIDDWTMKADDWYDQMEPSEREISHCFRLFPVNTKHLHNICKMLDQRRKLPNIIGTPFLQPPLPLYTIYQGGQQNKSNSRRQTQYCMYLIIVRTLANRYDNIFN